MEIFLKRPHSQVPWGFRIIGGSDSHLPIIVSKVLENSVAEESGLQEDLILERVNNVPTCGLSHSEVNQLILAAENELLLTIKRVNLETLILATLNDEEESDSEISNILRQIINKDTFVKEDKSVRKDQELEEMGLKREFETIVEPNKHQMVDRNCRDLALQPPGKKWSTFLQKPQNPTPKEKNQAPPVSKENRYKVIITKQPKKEKAAPQITIDIPRDEKQEIVEEEHFTILEYEQNLERQIDDTQILMEDHDIVSKEIEMHNLEEIGELQENIHESLEETHEEYEEKEILENETKSEITYVPTEAPSLEEQLAAVQKQLQELAQLPSTIQDTLSAVTQQLANIVGIKVQEIDAQAEDRANKCPEIEVELQEEEKEIGKLAFGENMAEVLDEVSESAEMEGPQSDVLSDICEEQELSEIIEEDGTQQHITEALVEDKIENTSQKKQLEDQLREQEEGYKEKNFVRPIILPGGRKWVDPDDAVVKVKNPKMTDDKICNTIETFSEVDEWNRKWPWSDTEKRVYKINFLKYTPPPKNLEYLQRSEVYRLIHGMEPPMKGICQRSEKILAEQDYYTPGGN